MKAFATTLENNFGLAARAQDKPQVPCSYVVDNSWKALQLPSPSSLCLPSSKTSFILVLGAQPLSVLPGQLFADTTATLESCSSSPGWTGVLPIIQSHPNKASNRSDILYSRESLHGDEHGLVIHWIFYWPQGQNTVYPSVMTDTLLAARAINIGPYRK